MMTTTVSLLACIQRHNTMADRMPLRSTAECLSFQRQTGVLFVCFPVPLSPPFNLRLVVRGVTETATRELRHDCVEQASPTSASRRLCVAAELLCTTGQSLLRTLCPRLTSTAAAATSTTLLVTTTIQNHLPPQHHCRTKCRLPN